MDNQVGMVTKAFEIAYKGFMDFYRDSEQAAMVISDNCIMTSIAPMAAEIYRQMTSVIVLTMGDKEHRAADSDLEVLKSVVGSSGIDSNYLLGSHDLHIYSTNVDRIDVIIKGLMGNSKVETPEDKEEGSCGHK